jgi:rhamnose transport system substrate-binding protein
MTSRWISYTAVAGMAGMLVAACGSSSSSSGSAASSGASLNITFLPKQVNNPYFDTASNGGKQAATELGGTFNQVGPSTATGAAQVQFIQTLTQQHVGAIVISAADPDAIAPALKQARSAGIKVVGYDSSPATDARDLFVNQADTKGIGDVQVQMICDEIPGCAGKIAILSATSTATNQNAWIDEMKVALQQSKYSKLQLVKTAYGNDDPQESFNQTQGLLSAYPDLKGIIAPTSVGIVAAAQVLDQTGKSGKVQLTGLGTPNSMKKYVTEGTAKQFALWDVQKLGYLAYEAAAALIQGKITGKEGDTFTAGSLGSYTVGANGVIVLGPPTVFTKDNVANFNF